MKKILILLILNLSFSLLADTIKCYSDKNEAFIGDEITFTFKIEKLGGEFFVEGLPQEMVDYGDFRVKSVSKVATGDFLKVEIKAYVFGINEVTFPLNTIKILKKDGETPYTVEMPKVKIKDRISANSPPPDVASPIEIPKNFSFIYIILIIFIAIVISLLGYYLKKKKNLILEKGRKEKSIEEKILTSFYAILKKSVLSSDDYKEITFLIRSYIENKTNIKALEMTTFELMETLEEETSLDIFPILELKKIFYLSDLVKFGKYFPSVDEEEEARKVLKSFIDSINKRDVRAA